MIGVPGTTERTFDDHLNSIKGETHECECCHGQCDINVTTKMSCGDVICPECMENETRVSECCLVAMPLGKVCPDPACGDDCNPTYVVYPNPIES